MSSTSQLIFVNSADRTSGTAEDFYVNLVDINNDFEDTSLAIQELCIQIIPLIHIIIPLLYLEFLVLGILI